MLNIYCKMRMAQLKNKEELNYNEYYSDAIKHMDSANDYSNNNQIPKCRVCLQKASIYILEDDKRDIIEALQIFGNVYITEDSECPKHLCKICFKFIKEAILFRNTAIQADNILRQPIAIKKEESCDAASDGNDQVQNCNYTYDSNTHQRKAETTLQKLSTPKKAKFIKKNNKILPTEYKAKKVPCPICNKIYFKSYLDEHITIHDQNNPKNHVCEVCGKGYRLKTSLARHITTHRKGYPYKCKSCPYKTKCSVSLKLHMRIHTRDYKYRCALCPAKYIAKPNLNHHMLRHKEPQFKCDTCPKAYYTKRKLQDHKEVTHLGMKKHICSFCGKEFGYRHLMMKHELHFHKREKMKSSTLPNYLQDPESDSDNT